MYGMGYALAETSTVEMTDAISTHGSSSPNVNNMSQTDFEARRIPSRHW